MVDGPPLISFPVRRGRTAFVTKNYFPLWLQIARAPLLIYPAVLLANVMSLARQRPSKPVPSAELLAPSAQLHALLELLFLWTSTLYPLVYVYCARQATACARKDDQKNAMRFSLVPLLYLCLVAVLFFGAIYT
jgi:uncharacterized Tic20 family protein